MADLEINLRVTPGMFRWAAVGFLMCGFARELSTEGLTLTTTYPAPYASYNKLITTGDAFLARDGGNVGVGTSNPQYKLDVNGAANASGSITAAGIVSGSDVKAGGQSCITNIVCTGGISCPPANKVGNTVTISQP